MKNSTTEIAFLLDRSGSMASCLEPTITAFNAFLRRQRELPGSARMTLIQFDDQYEVHAESLPVSEMVELTTETYQPRGSTALLDATGRMLDELWARIEKLPPEARPAAVLVAILTDGYENSSTRFTWKDVAGRIARLRDKEGWQFFFLGADADAIAQAGMLHIAASHVSLFAKSKKGLSSVSEALHRKMAPMRKMAAGERLTEQEARDVAASLGEIVREEERKEDPRR